MAFNLKKQNKKNNNKKEDKTMTIIKWKSRPAYNNIFDNMFDNEIPTGFGKTSGCLPAANILEKDKNYEILLAFPGVQKSDLNISVENNTLTISYDHKQDEDKEEQILRQEFVPESFSRSFVIPKETNVDKIKANYENGVLRIEIPKAEQEKSKLTKSISIS